MLSLLDREGSIHDLRWSPNGREFICIFGQPPPKAVIFNAWCEPVYSFGTNKINTLMWSLDGRRFILAGFGNMSGSIHVYNRRGQQDPIKISQIDSPYAVTCRWSACGNAITTATVSPKLRVDNNFTVFDVYGRQIHRQMIKVNRHVWQCHDIGAV